MLRDLALYWFVSSLGYGASDGHPTEKNLYSDVQAAWNALRTRYGIR